MSADPLFLESIRFLGGQPSDGVQNQRLLNLIAGGSSGKPAKMPTFFSMPR
jgi:hypothetical protein